MKPLLSLIHSIWLVRLLLVSDLPVASAVSPIPMLFAYDGQKQAGIAYDGKSPSVFNYDPAGVRTKDGRESSAARIGHIFVDLAGCLAAKGASVASGMGGEVLPATLVRTIQKGERIGALEAELAQRTYTSGGLEHAVISLNSGERVIVSGGSGGIQFGSDLRRVIGHTHPSTTGPSAADFQMLRDTGQRHSYIYELFGGGKSRFNVKE